MIDQFANGSRYFFKGLRLLKHPRILPFVVLPVLFNAALFYFGFQYLTGLFDGWIDSFVEKIPTWLGFIETVLVWLFRIALLLIFAFSFTFAANLIGSPFYGLMAEQVEAIKNPDIEQFPFDARELIAVIPRSIIRELQKLLYYLLRVIPLLLLSLLSLIVTPLATLTPALWFLFGAFMLTIQYVDYAYDNHKLSFKVLAGDLRGDRATSLGFGSVCTVAAMLPLFNIIAVPAAACGGTLYFVERLQKEDSKKNR